MKVKNICLSWLFIYIILSLFPFIDGGICAADSSIEVITSSELLGTFAQHDILAGQFFYNIQGPNKITEFLTQGSGKIQIDFKTKDKQKGKVMENSLQLQYLLMTSTSEETDWSEWFYFNELPLTVKPEKIKEKELIELYIRFKVPQTLFIREGIYLGELKITTLF